MPDDALNAVVFTSSWCIILTCKGCICIYRETAPIWWYKQQVSQLYDFSRLCDKCSNMATATLVLNSRPSVSTLLTKYSFYWTSFIQKYQSYKDWCTVYNYILKTSKRTQINSCWRVNLWSGPLPHVVMIKWASQMWKWFTHPDDRLDCYKIMLRLYLLSYPYTIIPNSNFCQRYLKWVGSKFDIANSTSLIIYLDV